MVNVLRELQKNHCQMILFSATYCKEVLNFAEIIVPNAIILTLKREVQALDNIKQYYVRCWDQNEKFQAIRNIYGSITIGQAIIFCHVRIYWQTILFYGWFQLK